ncbi:hypothetical protein [Jatrophihabitans sp.]|uniref:hypothetical protein n=1 Tax=Jatrophihabitans sp. TaxID=1932789 RepID=UPI0030C6A715|nr:hypothetical protein [Jatrophihabitans sp.]
MKLKAGQPLYSVTDDTTLLVIRSADRQVSLTCGGHEMSASKDTGEKLPMEGPAGHGATIGKRYVDIDNVVELLCTKPGDGELALDGVALNLVAAKQLPASD